MHATKSTTTKQGRFCKLTPSATEPDSAMLTLTINGKSSFYLVENIGSDDAEYGLRLEKIGPNGCVVEVYDVELYTSNGYHGCSCKGFIRWGHCKHAESLVALGKAGQLPKPVCCKC